MEDKMIWIPAQWQRERWTATEFCCVHKVRREDNEDSSEKKWWGDGQRQNLETKIDDETEDADQNDHAGKKYSRKGGTEPANCWHRIE
jgi:hypothetical protein